MKKNLIIWGTAVILIITALLVTKFYKAGNSVIPAAPSQTSLNGDSSSVGSSEGQKAIDFTLTDLNGKKVSLKDFRGKNVYLNFWATWCPPCRGEMPGIEKVYQQYKDKNLVVLAVDLGEDSDTVKNFIKQNDYIFRVLLDSDQNVSLKYNVSAIPTSLFIDKNGRIVSKRVGALSEEEMLSYVKQILN